MNIAWLDDLTSGAAVLFAGSEGYEKDLFGLGRRVSYD
jgi:hypothetical protein